MRDCHLKNTCDRVVATCGLMPRLIPPGSLNCIFFLKSAYVLCFKWLHLFQRKYYVKN